MPLSSAHKQASREKILRSAARCFASKGFENSSIDEIMANAEMTRGAFYNHFSSKTDLYKEAILHGAFNSLLLQEKPGQISEQSWLVSLIDQYLSLEHINQKDTSCPLAFLVTDVAIQDPGVRKVYTRVFKGMNKIIQDYTQSSSTSDGSRILALTAMMIGGVAVGRALDDNNMKRRLMDSCKAMTRTILENT